MTSPEKDKEDMSKLSVFNRTWIWGNSSPLLDQEGVLAVVSGPENPCCLLDYHLVM